MADWTPFCCLLSGVMSLGCYCPGKSHSLPNNPQHEVQEHAPSETAKWCQRCAGSPSAAVTNLTESNLGAKGFISSHSLPSIIWDAKAEGTAAGVEPDAETMEERDSLTCSQAHNELPFLHISSPAAQERHHPQWLGPPTSIRTYEKAPQTGSWASLTKAVLLRFPCPGDLGLCQVDNQDQPPQIIYLG